MGGDVPLRHDVIAVHQYPIQRAGCRHQLFTGVGIDHLFDQCIHHRVFQPHQVAAAGFIGRAGMKHAHQLVAGGLALAVAGHHHIEIEVVRASLVQGRIDGTVVHLDPEDREISHIGCNNALKPALYQHDMETERVTPLVAQRPVPVCPASLGQQIAGLAQILAQTTGRRGADQRRWLAEDRLGKAVTKRLQQGQFVPFRQTRSGQFAIGKIAVVVFILVVKQIAVGPLEIQRQPEGLAHPLVLKQRTALIEDKALHPGIIAVRQLLAQDRTATERRTDIIPCPTLGVVFHIEIKLASLEALHRHHEVAVVLVGDPIEIELAATHRQVGAPVIGIAPIGDALAQVVSLHPIRATAQRLFQGHTVEGILPDPGTGKHRHLSGQQMQFRIDAGKFKTHGQRIQRHRPLDIAPIHAIPGVTMFTQGIEGEFDILGLHRAAIMKACRRIDPEGHRQTVLGQLTTFGQQAILGKGLVQAGLHQGFEHQLVQASRPLTTQGKGVEAVETADLAQIELPAPGRVRIHIVKMAESLGILGRVTQRHAKARQRGTG